MQHQLILVSSWMDALEIFFRGVGKLERYYESYSRRIDIFLLVLPRQGINERFINALCPNGKRGKSWVVVQGR